MDGKKHNMIDKDKRTFKRKNIYTKDQLMDFFSNISLPDGVISNYIEKDNYIEFIYNDTIYSALIDGGNWDEIKKELLRQKERKKMESDRIQALEKQDTLTKLYNKEYSKRIIEGFLETAEPESRHALMIVDIDNFDTVNENLGYIFGDTVLVNIADSLRKIFYDTDIAGRIGGDEFLIFLKNVQEIELLKEKAEEIYSVFRGTYTGEDRSYQMSCSIGIAVFPEDGADYMQLFLKADAALMKTRETRNNFYSFYQELICHDKSEQGISYQDSSYTDRKDEQQYIDRDCYEKYKINKTRAYGSSNFDKEITAFAFDIMSRTKDVNSAINLLLNKVRVQFDCDHICILEYTTSTSDLSATYFSSKDGIQAKEELRRKIPLLVQNLDISFDENGIYYVNHIEETEDEVVKNLMENLEIKALLQCGIFENGTLKGCVSIHDCEKPRYWTQYEVDSLVTITKIISSYLLKMRASERANQQLYRIKNYDILTGLPTLHKFKKDVRNLLEKYPDRKYAIVYSDITQFKYINDTLGYEAGDKILCEFAALLSESDTMAEGVSRVSEDNFLAVLQYEEEESFKNHIFQINERFHSTQKAKYPGTKFIVVSGVSLVDSSEDITVAIDNANIARKSIKGNPKITCKFFDNSMKVKLQWEAEITNSMEQALKDGEFIVYLQPKIGLSENILVGAEALVRWKKGDSLVPPNDFIPIFEKNGFVVNLDFYIYEEVCKILRRWIDEECRVVPISVNVSRIHLNDENFVKDIKRLVDAYRIPYHCLELELTESIFLSNTEVAINTMKELRRLGFGVSIDDFGAGYSSLNLLKDMATDVIKLDKEFFGRGDMQKEEQIILSSIISMAKQLNMKVLSEGVETQNQSDFLKSVYCDMAQGYLYSKPIPVAEFEELMKK
jgi:diguanylate cyclase (GGDEF)-like protein